MSDRKRPFNLLRLTGVPVTVLRRIVGLETVVPLLVVAVVSIATGLVASDLYLRSERSLTLLVSGERDHPDDCANNHRGQRTPQGKVPGPGYFGVVLAGLAVSLGIVALSLPLIRRITGPEVARND